METRKFIWNFFLFIIVGAATLVRGVDALKNGGTWNWISFIILGIGLSIIANKIEETFKK